jgi:hypothetical protein
MAEIPETPPVPRRKSCLVPVLIGVIAVLLVALGLIGWNNRAIRPVQLSAEEKAAVEAKVDALQVEATATPAEPSYEKGKKEIVLTERELNGLLNQHTSLGGKLKFELGSDAVNARLETDLDPELPLVGGKKLKARARFTVKTAGGVPSLVLDDFTVWGVSLPNDWLAQLKGKDLLGEILGGGKGGQVAGIEAMSVRPGELEIRLKD